MSTKETILGKKRKLNEIENNSKKFGLLRKKQRRSKRLLSSTQKKRSNESPFANEDIVYELRIGQLNREPMKSFHQRMQIFVLLYIESSNYLEQDEIWDVLVLYKRMRTGNGEIKYETLGYITLYKYFAWPNRQRLRISQVIIFPPFQRKRHGFEMLQQVNQMCIYDNFIEVNIEDPNYNCQFLRCVISMY